MDELYDISGMKCVCGIKSYDDMSGSSEASLYTMNDFDITYLEDEKKYVLSVETVYEFSEKNGDKNYINRILSNFTAWMIDNGYNTNYKVSLYDLFTEGLNITSHFNSIEQAYAVFKVIANAFVNS